MRGKGGKCGCWCRKILHVRGLGFYNMKNKGLNRNKILLLVWVLLCILIVQDFSATATVPRTRGHRCGNPP